MATIKVLACLALSVGLKHFSTFLLHLIKLHSAAARDGAIALGFVLHPSKTRRASTDPATKPSITLLVCLLYVLLPPPALTDAVADSVENGVNAFLLPLHRVDARLHHVTIALRPGAGNQDADTDTRAPPAPLVVCSLTPLTPLLWLLSRLAILPREPARFLALAVGGSTVIVPLLAPNLILALLTTTDNAYAKQAAAMLEVPVLMAVAALLFLQLRFAMRLLPVAKDICKEKDPKRRASLVEECMDVLPSVWDWGSWERCWRE
ncbi:hypothetical protein HDK77DRAFT_425107 [Phyllosticta capitalensis]|uniref:Uncharacterized protein n=1 Tax=Phyllosticta capitalensis TaxID=121624 RepID=A0ABR1YRH7_9PEZI